MGENLSCDAGESTTYDLKNAAGKGPSKDDALMDMQDRIIKDAKDKKLHSCKEDCAAGVTFCFTTVTFGDKDKINYVKSPKGPEVITDLKTGKSYSVEMIIAQYSGSVTLTCHCFGVISYASLPFGSRGKLEKVVEFG